MTSQTHEALRIGQNGSIEVEKIERTIEGTRVTYRVKGVHIMTTTEDAISAMVGIFGDTEARIEWSGNKPEYVFTRCVRDKIVNWFGFNLVAQRKFMFIIDYFESIADIEVIDGC